MKKILLLCAKGFETMEFSAFADVMGWAANDFGCPIKVETCGFTRTVVSTFNVPVVTDKLVSEISAEDYDALAIPGGFEEYGFYEDAFHPDFSALIRAFNDCGKPIASVCVAALALGHSGILDGRRATTYYLGDGRRQRQLAAYGAVLVNERVVTDGNVITSCCPETAADTAFALLGMFCPEKAAAVRRAMGYSVGAVGDLISPCAR